MNNYFQKMKKNRPLSADEHFGMVNLLSGLKRIRALATEKHCVAQEKAGERIFPTYPIQRQGEHKWKSYSR